MLKMQISIKVSNTFLNVATLVKVTNAELQNINQLIGYKLTSGLENETFKRSQI